MVRSLLEGAFVLSLVVWICGLLLTRRGKIGSGWGGSFSIPMPFWGGAMLVPLAGFAATLPTHTPFAAGQGMGRGLLLGAFGTIVSAWTLVRAIPKKGEGGIQSGTGAFAAAFALAVAVVCIPLLAMRGVVVDALMGVAVGWITATLLLLCGLNARDGAGRVFALGLMALGAWAATLCGWAALGELGGSVAWGANMTSVPWSAIAMPLASCVPLLLMLCAFVPSGVIVGGSANLADFAKQDVVPSGRVNALRWLAAGTLLLCVGVQFAHKIGIQPNLVRQLGLGVLASGLSWWMLDGRARHTRMRELSGGWHAMALPLLLFMAAGMVSFQMLSGVGVGIMLLGAWLTAGIALLSAVEAEGSRYDGEESLASRPAVASRAAFDLLRLLCFGAILLLYRLFEVRFAGDIRNILLPDHYALLGFVVGVAVPAALSGFVNAVDGVEIDAGNRTGASGVALLPRLIAVGAFALAAPALLLILFGTKCLLCLFFGLMLAPVIGATSSSMASADNANANDTSFTSFRPVPVEMLTSLFAIAIGLAVAQWTRHVLPVSLMARADKVRLITHGAGLAAVLLLIAYAGTLLRRLNAPLSSPADVMPKGGK